MNIARFWARTDRSGSCWLFKGATNNKGYGVVRYGSRNMLAHRLAYETAYATAIPAGISVCHHCDTPLCVRPLHLFLGTHADNMADMHAKGRRSYVGQTFRQPTVERRARGERIATAVLTEDQVKTIRNAYKPRIYTAPRLANEFGVSIQNIKCILQRRTWKHV